MTILHILYKLSILHNRASRHLRDLEGRQHPFTVILEGVRRGYQFTGDVSLGEILAGNVMVTSGGVPGQN